MNTHSYLNPFQIQLLNVLSLILIKVQSIRSKYFVEILGLYAGCQISSYARNEDLQHKEALSFVQLAEQHVIWA